MPLQYVIDGYNIINNPSFARVCRKTTNPRESLIGFIKTNKLCGSLKNKVVLVFDGYPKNASSRHDYGVNIEVIFSGEESADDKIKRMFDKLKAPKNTIVVTDDREIRFFVRSSGAGVRSVEEFIHPAIACTRNISGRDSEKETSKQELNYSQIKKINQELKNLWLNPDKWQKE